MPQFPLSGPSKAALADRRISQLFSHQAHAIDAVISGAWAPGARPACLILC